MRDSINVGLENLEKWYGKTDDTDVYFVCLGKRTSLRRPHIHGVLALDPNFKTAYAEESWNSVAFEEGMTKFESVVCFFVHYCAAKLHDISVRRVLRRTCRRCAG